MKKIDKKEQEMLMELGKCKTSKDIINNLNQLSSTTSDNEYNEIIQLMGITTLKRSPNECEQIKISDIELLETNIVPDEQQYLDHGKCKKLIEIEQLHEILLKQPEITYGNKENPKKLQNSAQIKKGLTDSLQNIQSMKKKFQCKP